MYLHALLVLCNASMHLRVTSVLSISICTKSTMLYVYEVQPFKYMPSFWKINLNFEEQPGKKGEKWHGDNLLSWPFSYRSAWNRIANLTLLLMSALKSDTLYNTMHGSKKTGPTNKYCSQETIRKGRGTDRRGVRWSASVDGTLSVVDGYVWDFVCWPLLEYRIMLKG
jgi:hypothetical protein